MGFRRITFLFAITFAMSLAACGDNKKFVFDDAGTDMAVVDGDMDDAPPDAGCPVGQTLCGTECVDLKTNNDHCGSCPNDCGTGTCQTHNGMTTCCPSGLTNCDGTCVDLTTDPDHCGSCPTDCGTNECKTDGGSSICCPANEINCNGQCVDPMSDEAACGGCVGTGLPGVACTGLTDTCCNGQCVNVDIDNGDCGMCGTMCDPTGTGGPTTTCHSPGTGSTAGTDAKCCAPGETNCSGSCVSLVLSDANCGGCGLGCTVANTHCQAADVGSTPACCLNTDNNCNGTCSNPLTDNNNCGGCSGLGGTGSQCGGSDSCKSGLCCGPQELTCGGQCVDPDTNPNHCGGCNGAGGVACTGATPVCSDGQCVAGCDISETACGNACVTTSSDPNNCGTCGNKCSSTEVCNGGSCVSTTTGCTGGKILCDGACVDPMTDENHCGGCPGTTCDATDTCDGGICCDSGTVNTNGICCPIGWLACDVGGGVLQCKDPTDDSTCGACGMDCTTTGGSCTTGTGGPLCCGATETRCGSSCVNLNADNGNCGTCGTTCTSPDACTPTVGTGNAQCCNAGANELNCDGACINKLTDADNCGACDNDCGGTNICSSGHCCPLGSTAFTVGANTVCCPAGQFSCTGLAGSCTAGTSTTACGVQSQCPAPIGSGTGLVNCGAQGQLCNPTTHMCIANCGSLTLCPGNQCVDTQNDPNNCGGCGGTFACPAIGQTCSGGVCQPCSVGPANGCGGQCVDTNTSNQNCGGCAGAGGDTCDVGESCQGGHCCATGTTWCASANACVNTQTDSNNCGGCGAAFACGSGETCQNGSCECSFGQNQPGPVGNCSADTCYTSTVDPKHCGLSCTDCTTGPGNANRVCVNGTCQTSCPAPLTNCPAAVGDPFNFRHCVNTSSDNLNCGACGTKCPAGQGCSNGGCVPLIINPPPATPAKCVGGGPPISVPTGGGQQTCTGNLGSVSFLFGLCSRSSIGPISRDIFQDAFHSNLGGYKASCTSGDDSTCVPFKRCTVSGALCSTTPDCGASGGQCAYPIKCVQGKCVGGGIGSNGRSTLGTMLTAISNTGTTSVGGDFWTFGTIGLEVKGSTIVYLDHINGPAADLNTNPLAQNGPVTLNSKDVTIYGNAEVKGGWFSNQQGSYTVTGTLKTASTCTSGKPIPQVSATGGITCLSPFKNYTEPCGKYDGSDGSLIPIAQTIVPYFRDPTHNDNALIGLKYNALDGTSGHLDLPCGVYYLNTIATSGTTTIYVRGRVALVVGGAVRLSQPVIFDLDPGSSLDIFAGGVLDMSQSATLGSPAYPARTRMYLGSATCGGSGETCNDPTDCCSGGCSTCPVDATGKPTGPCTGANGTCTGSGSGLSKSVSLSQGGNFNGLLWSGYGIFTHQSPLEMYGSIYTGYFDASGVTTVHYDKAATELGQECPPIPPGTACESTRDCATGQACGPSNTCGACNTTDAPCIPPADCVSGVCTF